MLVEMETPTIPMSKYIVRSGARIQWITVAAMFEYILTTVILYPTRYLI